ncbi:MULTISPECIES: MATE family efflux transporter [unclassified Vibrio]|uniref:Multidrug resistance protein NorM n=1 Tax=Vibrio sp. HB236076 TaxID=3232307 RepID=A0AB39HFX6_9VIBR|nr:MATE family efflux transporter [Vibrio sp. HB161653]MDP5253247.1 MATE family efflux transporter [Vibrio sp. HB161653]
MATSSYRQLAKRLFTMTLPMVFGVLSLMSFQLVDSAFIGQLGVLPLAAQGFTLPLQMVIIGIQVGLGIATTAVISLALGQNKPRYAKQLGGLVILVGSIGVAIISLMIWLCRDALLYLLSAPQSVYPVIDSYWPIWLMSAWVGAVLYFLYSLCRANGNTVLPGSMMVVTSLLNMALDPIFIFTFDLGINGAAYATIVAFSLGIVFVAPKVSKRQWISKDWSDLSIISSLRALGNIMGPAMFSQLIPPLSSILATKLVASFGTAAVAAWAVGSRYEFFAIVIVLALTMSMPPMIGRLKGEGKIADIQRLMTLAFGFILLFQTLVALITKVFATPLAQLLSADPKVNDIVMIHLTWVPISLGALGICMLVVSSCNALSHPYTALFTSALRLFACFLPCLWLGAHIAQLQGLFIGAFVGNILAGLVAWWLFRRVMAKISSAHPA